ncbi:MAG: hypothetical protein A2728_00135 [Candidatus Spechtbacteria bacterium RIFCSPHIGHO2_01_FULL_38_11]|nr:MAG: hypothetical protein A2728_00135 [Candidatus Spechtbacteria bacterium RIFCSPHIGHO2_01_FULL_38_11]
MALPLLPNLGQTSGVQTTTPQTINTNVLGDIWAGFKNVLSEANNLIQKGTGKILETPGGKIATGLGEAAGYAIGGDTGKAKESLQKVPDTIVSESIAFNKKWKEDPLSMIIAFSTPSGAINKAIQPAVKPSIDKLLSAIKEAKPVRNVTDVMYHAERSARAVELEGALKSTKGEKVFGEAKKVLAGELPKPDFTGVRGETAPTGPQNPFKLQQDDIDILFDYIRTAPDNILRGYEKMSAMTGLNKILGGGGGQIPQKSEMALLEKLFGPDLTKVVEAHKGLPTVFAEGFADVLNVPRAMMSAADLSAPFRQGFVLSTRHPVIATKAFVDMFKAAFSPTAYKVVQEGILKRSTYPIMKDAGLYIADESASLLAKEERFMSNLAQRIPGIGQIVKASERGYVTFLNKLRADTFDNFMSGYIKSGASPSEIQRIGAGFADFINNATGRGSMGKAVETYMPLANAMFFSPRYIASRVNMLNPVWYFKMPPEVRKEAAKTMVSFGGTVVGILSLAKLGGLDVEMDPRSSDFAKIRAGNIRWDFGAGFQQWIKLLAVLGTGEFKSAGSKKIYKLDPNTFPGRTRANVIIDFGRGKLAPIPALAWDLIDGQNMIGQPVGLEKEAIEKLVPLYIQDLVDAYKEDGFGAAVAVGIPGFFGVGTQTYNSSSKNLPGLPNLRGSSGLPGISSGHKNKGLPGIPN